MDDAIVVRPGTALWDQLVAQQPPMGQWQSVTLTGAVADEMKVPDGTVVHAALVATYIGETEKNLAQVLERAQNEGSVLLFDEADAIFGSRTALKDAHDRYADQQVSYLLARTEELAGVRVEAHVDGCAEAPKTSRPKRRNRVRRPSH